MTSKYGLAYRLGVTPWERYATDAATGVDTKLDREETQQVGALGRALDLGCGRGLYTTGVARRGWLAVGVDAVPDAIDSARRADAGPRFVVGDVTDLRPADLGTFAFFLDVGCFHTLSARQRLAEGRSVTALADPGATLLLLALGPTRLRHVVGGCRSLMSRTRSHGGTSCPSSSPTPPDWGGRSTGRRRGGTASALREKRCLRPSRRMAV